LAQKYPRILVPVILPAYTTYEDGIECFEMSAHKIQTPENHPEERMQHSEQGESLKSNDMSVIQRHRMSETKALKYL
jgi:hypothetical protein